MVGVADGLGVGCQQVVDAAATEPVARATAAVQPAGNKITPPSRSPKTGSDRRLIPSEPRQGPRCLARGDRVELVCLPPAGGDPRWQNPSVPTFPSMKGRALERVLLKAPLNYRVARQSGSHRRLVAPGRPPLTFSYHDGDTVPPGVVRKILVKDVGLTESEALELLGKET